MRVCFGQLFACVGEEGEGVCLVDGEVMASQHAAQLGLCEVVPAAFCLLHYASLHVIRLLALNLHIPAPHVPLSARLSSLTISLFDES